MGANSVDKLMELMEREIEELVGYWMQFEFVTPINEEDLNAVVEDIAENVSRHFRPLELRKLEELREEVYKILDVLEIDIDVERATSENLSEILKYLLKAMIWLKISEKIEEVIEIAYFEEFEI